LDRKLDEPQSQSGREYEVQHFFISPLQDQLRPVFRYISAANKNEILIEGAQIIQSNVLDILLSHCKKISPN